MKKFALLLTLLSLTLSVSAQKQMRIWQGGEATKVTLVDARSMAFSGNGSTIDIGGTIYQTADIDSITMIPQVYVTFNESTASVSKIPASVKDYITVATDGAHVTITNTNVSNEVEFILSGTSSDGSFTYVGSYKATICLNGLDLASQRGGAIDIQCGKRIALVLEDGTTNSLADYAAGEQKSCLYCKGHLEVEGSGTLNVSGNLTHAIKSKEYVQLKKSTGTINIVKSVGDAININQYFEMRGGTVNITSTTMGDGIQVDSTSTETDEFNGQTFIRGGRVNIEITQEDCKAIKSAGDITISGGDLYLYAKGRGSRGIQTNESVTINKEEDGIRPGIVIEASGIRCGNEEHSDDPHRCMGMKIDRNLTIDNGYIIVENTGSKSRGIKVDGTFTFNKGTLKSNVTTTSGTTAYNETR